LHCFWNIAKYTWKVANSSLPIRDAMEFQYMYKLQLRHNPMVLLIDV